MTTDEEARHIEATAARLEREFPTVAPEEVRSLVDRQWRLFRDARVRDYVPLLVGRQARDSLRQRAAG